MMYTVLAGQDNRMKGISFLPQKARRIQETGDRIQEDEGGFLSGLEIGASGAARGWWFVKSEGYLVFGMSCLRQAQGEAGQSRTKEDEFS